MVQRCGTSCDEVHRNSGAARPFLPARNRLGAGKPTSRALPIVAAAASVYAGALSTTNAYRRHTQIQRFLDTIIRQRGFSTMLGGGDILAPPGHGHRRHSRSSTLCLALNTHALSLIGAFSFDAILTCESDAIRA